MHSFYLKITHKVCDSYNFLLANDIIKLVNSVIIFRFETSILLLLDLLLASQTFIETSPY